MSRHSSTTNDITRTKESTSGKKTTIDERKTYIKKEETPDRKRHNDDYASTAHSVSFHSHQSQHDRHGSDRHRSETADTRHRYDRYDTYEREEARHEKRPRYPDRDSRHLIELYYTDRLEDRLVHQADHGGKGKNHRNAARQRIKAFETAFKH